MKRTTERVLRVFVKTLQNVSRTILGDLSGGRVTC